MSNGMSNIANVVVLMLENRSFDNLLGWLKSLLNLAQVRQDQPAITARCTPSSPLRNAMVPPPNDLHRSMVAAMVRKMVTHPVDLSLVRKVLATIRTREDAARFVIE
jgi:phospholipase C